MLQAQGSELPWKRKGWESKEHFHSLFFHLSNDFLSPGTGVVGKRPEQEAGPSIRGDEWYPGPG